MVEITNSILIAPKLAKDIALGRQPPLRKGCADEFMETVSYMVQGGDIVIDPNTREIITSAGLTLEQLLETKVKPHWLEPAAARSLELETWQAGNLSMQGELYNHFLEQCGERVAPVCPKTSLRPRITSRRCLPKTSLQPVP